MGRLRKEFHFILQSSSVAAVAMETLHMWRRWSLESFGHEETGQSRCGDLKVKKEALGFTVEN